MGVGWGSWLKKETELNQKSKVLKMCIPFGPQISGLGSVSMGVIRHLNQDVCSRMFITALFLIVGKLETA